MGGTWDDKQFLVAFFGAFPYHMPSGHALEGIFAEVAAVSLLAVNEKHRSLNLLRPGKKGLVQEALAADNVPAVIGVATALMLAAWSLIICVIVLDEPRSVFWKRIDDTTGALISS